MKPRRRTGECWRCTGMVEAAWLTRVQWRFLCDRHVAQARAQAGIPQVVRSYERLVAA